MDMMTWGEENRFDFDARRRYYFRVMRPAGSSQHCSFERFARIM
jgi:hypothetical protein